MDAVDQEFPMCCPGLRVLTLFSQLTHESYFIIPSVFLMYISCAVFQPCLALSFDLVPRTVLASQGSLM